MSLKARVLWATLASCIAVGTFWAQEKKEGTQGAGTPTSAETAPASPHNYAISAQDSAKKNPIKFTEVSVERGKKVFQTQCALCHGVKGDGKGDLATEMKLTLPDLTKPDALNARTDGDLFAIVGTAKEPMPSQKGRMTEPQIWNLVNYLRALSGKAPEKVNPKEVKDENTIVVPQ